jgi:cation diffusion facilitator family transporter
MVNKQSNQIKNTGLNSRITNAFLRVFVPSYQDTQNRHVRTKYGYLEGWTSIITNILLFALKFFLGLLINSISLIADSFHTLADVLTSVIVVIGFKVAKRPADIEHPYGHGRFETIATLVIAILLLVVGVNFFKDSMDRFIHIQAVKGSILVVLAMVLFALIKEWLARFSIDLGKRIDSSVLLADAWHHRSDAIAALLVAIAIVAALFNYHRVDAVFGMVVSGLIIYTGIDLGRTSASYLMGQAPSEDLISEIEEIARSVEGVVSTHKVVVHDYGGQKAISLHVQVDKTLSVDRSHEIATCVKNKISQELEDVSAEVHIEPPTED